MRNPLYCDVGGTWRSLGLLGLRGVMGAAFIMHGLAKIQSDAGWMGWMGDKVPNYLQAAAVVAEFGGGIGLVLGFLTPLWALGLIATMGVALGKVHIPAGQPFVDPAGGHSWELPAVYLACAVMFLLVGPGRFSIDALLCGKCCGASSATKGSAPPA